MDLFTAETQRTHSCAENCLFQNTCVINLRLNSSINNALYERPRNMKKQLSRAIAAVLMVLFSLSPAWATCGGGGGGGTGGVGGGNRGNGPEPTVYNVPWKIWEARTAPGKGLILYWFPATDKEIKSSSLRASRILSLYSAQCVSMTIADAKQPELQPIIGDS